MKKLFYALIATFLAWGSAEGQDSVRVQITSRADSIQAETCRGGTLKRSQSGTLRCYGAQISPRVTEIRRHADSIKAGVARLAPVVVTPEENPGSPGNIGYAVSYSYSSGILWMPSAGQDTVTVCPVVENMQGQKRIGWPVVRMTTVGDSARWVPRSGNPLASMCAKAFATVPDLLPDSLPGMTWLGVWIDHQSGTDARLYRPFAGVSSPFDVPDLGGDLLDFLRLIRGLE